MTATISDRIFEELQTSIIKGEFVPGAKINEPELSKRFGISRGPLREAIRRLEGCKLVSRVPHAGVRVVSLNHEELLEIYDIREALEGMACRLAARHMTEQEVNELWQLLKEHGDTHELKEGVGYYQKEGDFDFHYRIINASRNDHLIQILCGDLYHLLRMYRYQFSSLGARPKKAYQEHIRIVEAIADHDEDLAELLMRRHINASRQNLVWYQQEKNKHG